MAKRKTKKQHKTKKIVPLMSPEKYIRTKAVTLPVYQCYVYEDWKEVGMSTVYVSRQHAGGGISFCSYLVDLYCLGVKDSFFGFNVSLSEWVNLVHSVDEVFGLQEISYELAHNIVYAADDYVQELGLESCADFRKITRYFLQKDEEVEIIEVTVGDNGMPHLVADFDDKPRYYLKVLAHLEKTLGRDGFRVTDTSGKYVKSSRMMQEPLDIPGFRDEESLHDVLELSEFNFSEEKTMRIVSALNAWYYGDFVAENPVLREELASVFQRGVSEGFKMDHTGYERLLGAAVEDKDIDLIYEFQFEKNASAWRLLKEKFPSNVLVDYMEIALQKDNPETWGKLERLVARYPETVFGRLGEFFVTSEDPEDPFPPFAQIFAGINDLTEYEFTVYSIEKMNYEISGMRLEEVFALEQALNALAEEDESYDYYWESLQKIKQGLLRDHVVESGLLG